MDKCKPISVQIIENNLDIVKTISDKFKNKGVSDDDLMSIGCIGLIKAANEIEKGKFTKETIYTYIVSQIEDELLRFFKVKENLL